MTLQPGQNGMLSTSSTLEQYVVIFQWGKPKVAADTSESSDAQVHEPDMAVAFGSNEMPLRDTPFGHMQQQHFSQLLVLPEHFANEDSSLFKAAIPVICPYHGRPRRSAPVTSTIRPFHIPTLGMFVAVSSFLVTIRNRDMPPLAGIFPKLQEMRMMPESRHFAWARQAWSQEAQEISKEKLSLIGGRGVAPHDCVPVPTRHQLNCSKAGLASATLSPHDVNAANHRVPHG
ncbi:hypothetical protein SELMODRAFT_427406 [Selaginella moellendorffii]|uniref:Uncharacterized protein n=1 Tax=Selaginella moellendorffii TaxID=88036 RepID=D8SZH5_SELML|nr:hypothetical protein SELMODRAFT_427406 [Selaginella moellendorffii]